MNKTCIRGIPIPILQSLTRCSTSLKIFKLRTASDSAAGDWLAPCIGLALGKPRQVPVNNPTKRPFRLSRSCYLEPSLQSRPSNLSASSRGQSSNATSQAFHAPGLRTMPTKEPVVAAKTQRRRKAPTLREHDWEPLKTRIVELHVKRNMSLPDVRALMQRERGFEATYVMRTTTVRTLLN